MKKVPWEIIEGGGVFLIASGATYVGIDAQIPELIIGFGVVAMYSGLVFGYRTASWLMGNL